MSNMAKKLKDYCTVISGYAFKSKDLSEGTDIPVIKIGNISNGENIVIDNSTQYVSKELLAIDEKYHIKNGDILISLTGSHMNQPNSMVGRCCRSLDNTVYLLNQRAGKIIPKKTIDKDFLYYVFRLQSIQYAIANRAYGGANQVNVSPKDVMGIKFNIPDISVQKKIAKVFVAYDSLIENNNKRIRLLEQMAESLYKEWFVRFRFPGYEDVEFENGVPKGWEWQMLVDVTKLLQRGISPIYDDAGIYTVISQKCIRGKTMDISEAKKQIKDYKEMLNLQDEDTVICSTGTGTLGRVGKVIGEYPNTTFDSHVTLARAKNGIGKQFLYGSIKNLQPRFMNMGIGSTNQQELYISLIRKTKILMPTDDLQQKFEDIVKPLHDEIGLIIKKNKYLIRQRDMLLPRLMSGKLEV